jgi:hypothetical protein
MGGHHLILGELTDFFTGLPLKDTHDERYRQRLARLLVEKKGYRKKDITPRVELTVRAGGSRAVIPIDFLISLSGRIGMVVKYGPGSLVTRHRPVLAASRLVAGYQVPVAVVTNGEDADVLDGATGRVMASGLDSLPSRVDLEAVVARARFREIDARRMEMEERIIFCYEVDGACPCDDTVCRIEE